MLKIAGLLLVGFVALGLVAIGGALWWGEHRLGRTVEVRVVPVAFAKADGPTLKLGKYLFESRGCAECHGMDGGGRVVIDSPDGMFVRAPDITPAKGGPVAAYAEADWVRAIRHGVSPAGRPLMIMPSEDYNRMSDADFSALVAYTRALPPQKGTPGELRLPRLVKALYGVGLVHDASEKIDHRLPPSTPVPVSEGPEHGAYVANLCLGCHGPKYSGGNIPGGPPDWPPASNLTPGAGSVMPRYPTSAEFIAMMRTGRRPDGTEVSKVMPFMTLANLNDTDLKAVYAFLKTLPERAAGGR